MKNRVALAIMIALVPALPARAAAPLHIVPAMVTVDTGGLKLIVETAGSSEPLGAPIVQPTPATGIALASTYNLEVIPLTVHVPARFLAELHAKLAVGCSVQHGGQLVGHTDYPLVVPAGGNLDANFNLHVERTVPSVAVDHINCHLETQNAGQWTLLSEYLQSAGGKRMMAALGVTLDPASVLDNVVTAS